MKFFCSPNIYLSFIVLLVTLKLVANASLTNFYPTADSELDDLLEVCDKKRVHGVDNTINELGACLKRTLTNPRSMANMSSNDNRSLECRDPRNYRACYSPVVQKINMCEPGRGDTVQKIQNALYHQFCMDGGSELKRILEKSGQDGCPLNYEVAECTSDSQRDDWRSLDVCKSFRAFRLCQKIAMLPCSNDTLTKLILDSYEQVEKGLNCSSVISSGSYILQLTWITILPPVLLLSYISYSSLILLSTLKTGQMKSCL